MRLLRKLIENPMKTIGWLLFLNAGVIVLTISVISIKLQIKEGLLKEADPTTQLTLLKQCEELTLFLVDFSQWAATSLWMPPFMTVLHLLTLKWITFKEHPREILLMLLVTIIGGLAADNLTRYSANANAWNVELRAQIQAIETATKQ